MSSPIPSSPITATSTQSSLDMKKEPSQLADRLTKSRDRLIETGYYLGDPSNRVHQNVSWRRVGRCHQLYTNPPSDAHDYTSPASSQTLSQTSQSPASTQPTIPPSPPPPQSPEPAILYAVVTVSYDSFITPCGNWKGPTEFTKSFSDLKLTFKGVCPSISSVFHDDFGIAMNNAHHLMRHPDVAKPNVKDKGFMGVPPETIIEEFRFRHALFEEPYPSDDPVPELDERFSLFNWPIKYPKAQEARDRMLLTGSHELVPVPAYDLNGSLIPPQEYRTALPGSVARVAFTLTNWFFDERYGGRPASNTFTADLVSLRVLVGPPRVKTPRKTKRTDPGLGMSPSPTKRARGK